MLSRAQGRALATMLVLALTLNARVALGQDPPPPATTEVKPVEVVPLLKGDPAPFDGFVITEARLQEYIAAQLGRDLCNERIVKEPTSTCGLWCGVGYGAGAAATIALAYIFLK